MTFETRQTAVDLVKLSIICVLSSNFLNKPVVKLEALVLTLNEKKYIKMRSS